MTKDLREDLTKKHEGGTTSKQQQQPGKEKDMGKPMQKKPGSEEKDKGQTRR